MKYVRPFLFLSDVLIFLQLTLPQQLLVPLHQLSFIIHHQLVVNTPSLHLLVYHLQVTSQLPLSLLSLFQPVQQVLLLNQQLLVADFQQQVFILNFLPFMANGRLLMKFRQLVNFMPQRRYFLIVFAFIIRSILPEGANLQLQLLESILTFVSVLVVLFLQRSVLLNAIDDSFLVILKHFELLLIVVHHAFGGLVQSGWRLRMFLLIDYILQIDYFAVILFESGLIFLYPGFKVVDFPAFFLKQISQLIVLVPQLFNLVLFDLFMLALALLRLVVILSLVLFGFIVQGVEGSSCFAYLLFGLEVDGVKIVIVVLWVSQAIRTGALMFSMEMQGFETHCFAFSQLRKYYYWRSFVFKFVLNPRETTIDKIRQIYKINFQSKPSSAFSSTYLRPPLLTFSDSFLRNHPPQSSN